MTDSILLVDHDFDFMQKLAQRLRSAGYRVLGTTDGATAIQAAQKEHPALIILDISLPECDGLGVLRSMKQCKPIAGIPVVVLTNADPATCRDAAIQAGATTFMSKPVDEQELFRIAASCTMQRAQKARKARKILVVEDDDDSRRGICLRLKANGYITVEASDSLAGVSVAMKENPDLILLDLGLPGGNGFVFLDRIRAHAALALIPVVVLSAWDPESHSETVMRAKVWTFLRKPVDNEALLASIGKALE